MNTYCLNSHHQYLLIHILSFLSDIRFWLLLITINISGNLLFQIHIDSRPILIAIFLIVVAYVIHNKIYPKTEIKFIAAYTIVLLIPYLYLCSLFSWFSFFHIEIKIITGILLTVILGRDFSRYYLCIMSILSATSLICFLFNCFGIIVPFLPIENTNLDGGNIYRVSSIIYTQLYNLSDGDFNLRNSGIFWEPGVFQGYLNLALGMLILTNYQRTVKWWSLVILFSLTVISTLSTGGYIVLAILWMYLISSMSFPNRYTKYGVLLSLVVLIASVFFSLNFMYSKIMSDTSRLGVDFGEFGYGIKLCFGYSFSDTAFTGCGFKTASGILSLLKYTGIVGFSLFVMKLFIVKPFTYRSILWGIIIILIFMNDPFLTAGPFWWGTIFLWQYLPHLIPNSNIVPI